MIAKAFEERQRIEGVGKEVPITTNKYGGKQSATPYRFDLLDPEVMFRLAKVLAYGAQRYAAWNWKKTTQEENLNHAMQHIMAHLAGDTQDDHLDHALCRLMFACGTKSEKELEQENVKTL
jgi:hypothetical protein